jgi:hypothetical protein
MCKGGVVSQGRLCTNTTGAALRTVDAKVGVLDTVDSYNGKLVKWLGAGSRKPSEEESRIFVLVPAGGEMRKCSKNRQEASLKIVPCFGNTLKIMKREEVVATRRDVISHKIRAGPSEDSGTR